MEAASLLRLSAPASMRDLASTNTSFGLFHSESADPAYLKFSRRVARVPSIPIAACQPTLILPWSLGPEAWNCKVEQ